MFEEWELSPEDAVEIHEARMQALRELLGDDEAQWDTEQES